MLQSPAFLYHWELGYENPTVEGKVIRLNGYENASRLSYFLWGSMPDADLFAAAAGNKLGTQAEIEAQARRMLGDPKARETVTAFAGSWLNLDQVIEPPEGPDGLPGVAGRPEERHGRRGAGRSSPAWCSRATAASAAC